MVSANHMTSSIRDNWRLLCHEHMGIFDWVLLCVPIVMKIKKKKIKDINMVE